MARLSKLLIIICLTAIIVAGGAVAWSRYTPNQAIEILIPPEPELQGEIYVSGAVNNPGLYPLKSGDSIETILGAAGGTSSHADLSRIEIHVSESGETDSPQKIDINLAEAWLLEALPGIGETRAQAVVDYRCQNGPFHNTSELTKVKGIGLTTYEEIKHLIAVTD
jgi:competence protein ComEA